MTSAVHTHAPAGDSVVKIALNLTTVGFLCGLIVAVINHFTQPIRISNEARLRDEARRAVLPLASKFEPIEGFAADSAWYRGLDASGNTVGYVVPVKPRGYESYIEMMMGVDMSHKIVDFVLVKDKETPGLGAKAREESFRSRFRGRTLDRLEITKKPEGDKVLAITGATITSRAVAKGLHDGLQKLAELEAGGFRNIPPELAHSEGGHE